MATLGNTPQERLFLRMEARKSFSLGLLLRTEIGAGIDLTGAEISLVITEQRPDSLNYPVISMVAEPIDPTVGHVRFHIQAADMDLNPGEYYTTITLRSPDGYSVVLAKGVTEVMPNTEMGSIGYSYDSVGDVSTLGIWLKRRNVIKLHVGAVVSNGHCNISVGEAFPAPEPGHLHMLTGTGNIWRYDERMSEWMPLGEQSPAWGGSPGGLALGRAQAGVYAVAIGSEDTEADTNGTAIGRGAFAYVDAIAIGGGASSRGPAGIAIGKNAEADGLNESESVAIGNEASGTGTQAVAIGYRTATNGAAGGVSIGASAQTGGAGSVAVGSRSYIDPSITSGGVALGQSARVNGSQGTALGAHSQAAGFSTAVGYSANSGLNSAALGFGTTASSEESLALGAASDAVYDRSIAIGHAAATKASDTALIRTDSVEIETRTPGTSTTPGTATSLILRALRGKRWRVGVTDTGVPVVSDASTGAIAVDPSKVPAGGTTNQVLTKSSSADHALKWSTPVAPPTPAGLLPPGGSTSQILAKATSADLDVVWVDPDTSGDPLPPGGTPGQVLAKNTSVDSDAHWISLPENEPSLPAGGAAGQVLSKNTSADNDAHWVDLPEAEPSLPPGGAIGQVLTKTGPGDYTTGWADTAGGGGGWERQTSVLTTGPLSAGATRVGVTDLAASYRLLRVSTDVPARVRLYTNVAKRDQDLARPVGVKPSGDHGRMLEVVTTTELPAMDLSPTLDGFVEDGSDAVPYAVTSTSPSGGAVTVSFVWIRTE